MDEYDRWYRRYRRRQQIAEVAGWFLAGIGVTLAVGAFLWLFLIVFGTNPA